MPVQANKQERQLVKIFKVLNSNNKATLLAFAEFLKTRSIDNVEDQGQQESVTIPLDIERPGQESVIKAIKRLSATYPMVDKEKILHPISALMTAHMLQGKEAEKVIDELQILFLQEYETLINADSETSHAGKDNNGEIS
jgi:hypothetical protein